MTISVDEFTALKKKQDTMQREIDRGQAALSLLMERLSKEFDCSSTEEADYLISELEKEEKVLKDQCDAQLARLREDFPDMFEE